MDSEPDRSDAAPPESSPRPIDHGFTHIALQVADLDRSLDFYRRYADMTPVHRRTSSDGVRVAWVTDHTRPFIIVLLETRVSHSLGGWAHLGIGVDSRQEVDRRLASAVAEGLDTFGPHDSGPPAGYYAIVIDPDGHNLEIAYGQEVAFTVATSDG